MSIKMDMDPYYSSFPSEKISPSFSSSLLEAIYRSIDTEEQQVEMVEAEQRITLKTRNKEFSRRYSSKREEIEKWMKRHVSSGFHEQSRTKPLQVNASKNKMWSVAMARNYSGSVLSNPSSSCSGSSAGFSSESESSISKSKSTNSGLPMPNPTRGGIRTPQSFTKKISHHHQLDHGMTGTNPSVKTTKSQSMKFYTDLKKIKQPISPGGRLATLISSLFLTRHQKKPKFTNELKHQEPVATNKTGCSSTSPVSKSYLSYKASSSPSSSCSTNISVSNVKFPSMDVTRDYEKTCLQAIDDELQKCGIRELLMRKSHDEDLFATCVEFEADEVSSCSSSDLFELEHLIGANGMEELPVYETTQLDANRPIANSLLM